MGPQLHKWLVNQIQLCYQFIHLWAASQDPENANQIAELAFPSLLDEQAVITAQVEYWEGIRTVTETMIAVGKGAVTEWTERAGTSPHNDRQKAVRSFQRSCDGFSINYFIIHGSHTVSVA